MGEIKSFVTDICFIMDMGTGFHYACIDDLVQDCCNSTGVTAVLNLAIDMWH